MSVIGRIFDVSTGCVDDGPGLRTVVFLKGCRLGCPWCHNPEGLSDQPQISLSLERCIHCGRCHAACHRAWPFEVSGAWRDGCEGTAACVEVCPSGARQIVGRDVTCDALVAELLENRDFFDGTGGGVTFSGGEPMLQAGFVLACASRLRERGVHVAVETAGFWSPKLATALADSADLVLFDLKHVDRERMKEVVGKDPDPILENLARLLASDVPLELRITLVPGFNDAPEDLAAFAAWLGAAPRMPSIWLQPFHRLATAKHERYGTRYPYAAVEPPTKRDVAEAARLFASHGLAVVTEDA